jgi:hypothetical protein
LELYTPAVVQAALPVNIMQITHIFVLVVTVTVPNVHIHPQLALYVHLAPVVLPYIFSVILNVMQHVPLGTMDITATVYYVILLVVVVQSKPLIVYNVLQLISESLDQILALNNVEVAITQITIQTYVQFVQSAAPYAQ